MERHNLLSEKSQCHPEWPTVGRQYRRVSGFWKLTIMLLVICGGCTNYDGLNHAVKASDKFVEDYADEFLANAELLKYTYNPRIQFFHDGNDSNDYMVFVHPDGLRLMCHTSCCLIDDSFGKIEPIYLDKGTYIFKKDTIITIHQRDTVRNYYRDFTRDNYLVFKNLKDKISKFGIIGYFRPPSKQYVKVYVNTKYYLLHMKDFNKMDRFGFEKDFLIREYKNGWKLLKAERPLDLG